MIRWITDFNIDHPRDRIVSALTLFGGVLNNSMNYGLSIFGSWNLFVSKKYEAGKWRRNGRRSGRWSARGVEIQWRYAVLRFVTVFLRAIKIFLRGGGNDSSRTSLSSSIREHRSGLRRWKTVCPFYSIAIIRGEILGEVYTYVEERKRRRTGVTFSCRHNTPLRRIDLLLLSR